MLFFELTAQDTSIITNYIEGPGIYTSKIKSNQIFAYSMNLDNKYLITYYSFGQARPAVYLNPKEDNLIGHIGEESKIIGYYANVSTYMNISTPEYTEIAFTINEIPSDCDMFRVITTPDATVSINSLVPDKTYCLFYIPRSPFNATVQLDSKGQHTGTLYSRFYEEVKEYSLGEKPISLDDLSNSLFKLKASSQESNFSFTGEFFSNKQYNQTIAYDSDWVSPIGYDTLKYDPTVPTLQPLPPSKLPDPSYYTPTSQFTSEPTPSKSNGTLLAICISLSGGALILGVIAIVLIFIRRRKTEIVDGNDYILDEVNPESNILGA